MLLVIPVSEADMHLADDVVALIKAFGPYHHHDLLVVGTEENAASMNKLLGELTPLFNKSDIRVFQGGVKGWPLGPNFYWRSTILHLYEQTSDIGMPWYWFELDNTPLKQGWLDTLQVEYNRSNAIFMGPKHATYVKGPEGELVVQGYHMCGTAIYPSNFVEHSTLWRVEGGIAFDVWVQWEVLPKLHETLYMQHNWKTRNYRRKASRIISDNFDMPHPDLHTNNPIAPDAVVCHGCKDGSLARLILDELDENVAKAAPDPDPLDEPTAEKPRFSTDGVELVFPKHRNRKKALVEGAV